MWKFQRKWLFLPLVLSLWLAAGSTSQAEEMYQISSSELTTLETNLNQLSKSNKTKQQLLTEQQMQLTEANQQLETVWKELTASLARANQSLTELENEAKRKIRVKTRQRNLWIVIAGGALYACISK